MIRPLSRAAFTRWILVSAAVVVVASLPGCGGRAGASLGRSAPTTLRVMTWNIHHGEGIDGRLDLDRIAALIREVRPDFVALQEVDRGVARTQGRDLPAELANLTGMSAVFRRNITFQGGEYGNATLSRWPILSVTNHHYVMLREGEQRGLLQIVAEVGGRKLAFWNTHIDHRPDNSERMSNVREISQLLAKTPHDVVLAGDFNDLPDSRVHRGLREVLRDAWLEAGKGPGATFPGSRPRRIDYIWIDPKAPIDVTSIQVIESDASDHWAVVADLRYRTGN